MYLIEQNAKGERFAATLNDVRSYSQALHDAERHFARNPDTVALYLWKDDGSSVVRTYFRDPKSRLHGLETLYGFHEWPEPYPEFPGSMPEPYSLLLEEGDKLVQMTQRVYDAELADADFKGYTRGFKVGIHHRNRLRIEKGTELFDRTSRAFWTDAQRPQPKPHPLPGSVRAGVDSRGCRA